MGLKKTLNRIEYIDHLIKKKSTGTPQELAEKLDVSERWIYELMNELKYDLGCPIEYSRKSRSYVYTERGRIKIEFMTEEEQRDIMAGNKKFEINFLKF